MPGIVRNTQWRILTNKNTSQIISIPDHYIFYNLYVKQLSLFSSYLIFYKNIAIIHQNNNLICKICCIISLNTPMACLLRRLCISLPRSCMFVVLLVKFLTFSLLCSQPHLLFFSLLYRNACYYSSKQQYNLHIINLYCKVILSRLAFEEIFLFHWLLPSLYLLLSSP